MISVTPVHGASQSHHHETSLNDTFDFLNTVKLDSGSLVDGLPTFDVAARWLTERGIAHDDLATAASAGAAALERVRAVRAALREVVHAIDEERPADPDALAEVNRAIAGRERIELVQDPDGVSVGHSHVGDPLDDALARLADPIVAEIQAGHLHRMRICDNETCRWLFYDESRAGRRRWCEMSSCGNRAKAARHRARLKALEAPATDANADAKAGPGIV